MLQKQIFFLNNLIIVTAIIFIGLFFVPIFTIDIPLDYKINGDTLTISTKDKDLNMKEYLFMKFEKNTLIISKYIGDIKTNKLDIQGDQIILDMHQIEKDDIKIIYRLKKSVMNYVLKRKK